MYKLYKYIYLLLPTAKPSSSLWGNPWCFSPPSPFSYLLFFPSFCLRMVLGYPFKSSSLFMCAEKTLVRLRSSPPLPLANYSPSDSSYLLSIEWQSHLYSCWFNVAEPRRGGESERPLFTITRCWNISTGDPTPLPYEPYQATNVEIRANEITIHSCLCTKRFLLHFQLIALSVPLVLSHQTVLQGYRWDDDVFWKWWN